MIKKTLGVLCGIILLAIAGFIVYLYTAFPAVGPPPDISVKGTPAQIARGKYLVHHVTLCLDCHSTRNWNKFAGPAIPGTEGKGGDMYSEKMGFPGTFYPSNITPYNLSGWSDGEIYRAITTGVTKNGSSLFPLMPYLYYSKMDPRDVRAIIAYIRTIEPIESKVPASDPNFPLNLIMRTIPQPADPVTRPPQSDTLAYGKYLATIAACADCHTPRRDGAPVEELFMAGGMETELPAGIVRTANLTPDTTTGIGAWTARQFVARFKMHDVPYDSIPAASEMTYQTVMPWSMFAGMTETDLKAIFTYLKSLKPIEHRVVKFTPKEQVSMNNKQ